VRTVAIPAPPVPFTPLGSKRLLALASDDMLLEQIRRGNEAAFSVVFERHAAGLLGFCRHMVGSPEDAEDAVQHTFAAAFRDLERSRDRQVTLKPWLYAIARNRCLSVLRSRREQAAVDFDLPTEGLAEQVERRAELRDLLRDLRELPEDLRAALLLSEAGALSHAEVAGVLGCDVSNVKALVFRARSGLLQRREARETPCADIRQQLSNLRGSSLRRNGLRYHLLSCAGCRAYSAQVRHQRQMLRAALPVVPSLQLKSGVLAAAGLGGGSAGGGFVAAVGAGLSASLGTGTLVQVAAVGGLLATGVAAGTALIHDADRVPRTSSGAAADAADSSLPGFRLASAGAKRPITPGVRPREPRVLEGGAELHVTEQYAGAAPPRPGRPDTDGSAEHETNANRPVLPEEDPPTGSTHGNNGPAAGVAPESRGGRPTAAPPGGSQVQGGPPEGTPVKGNSPASAPDRRNPPASAPDRRNPPASAPDRRGPLPSAPDRRNPPASGPAERSPPEAAPVQPAPRAPKPNAEPRANPTAPESARGAASDQAQGPQPPPAPAEKTKGPGT
jgi:RNA polymerase sigma factor (sigma-70 family)